uniref:RPGR-interacting protein 1 first C2 domain-containing protein n=1 Tax=Leptocylindrus danicus TaxID=163516 RepID=A0A7S2K4S9_9STRA|mmetsp:Transcript_17727/g.26407  ORF Transcript_17727/g.26407 Transcript_17727/m.26407 type:complete len:705 (+) Transcript_17727:126-2240(+)|eukprot:CAMPEP_0116009076 /NCGR_PEP_ID=MMETSP0321-20121206/3228_1 /TAXON_ID=163516 /ORGANISM="Leptocylindrus danicus var. danicus, Strain B650" /LENGTH=704 /DNA_ID=CAMNT_0003477991 /DNA_START=110 /DNA_END=2224 /DNA_ORIENTATION=-
MGEVELWKARYHSLQNEHDNLAKKCSAQELSLREMKTNYSKLGCASNRNKCAKESLNCGDMLIPRSVREQKETIELLDDTQRRYSKLQKDYRILQAKHKTVSGTLEKKTRDVETLKRRLAIPIMPHYRNKLGVRPLPKSSSTRRKKNNQSSGVLHSSGSKYADQGIINLRLNEALSELNTLREENTLLRNSALVDGDKEAVSKLESELKTTLMQLNIMKAKYESLVEKDKTRTDCEKYALDQVEEYNNMLRDLRLQLRKSQMAKVRADELAMYSGEQKEQIEELLEQNQFLEDQVSRLCEAPLIKAVCEKDFTAETGKYQKNIDEMAFQLEEKECALTSLEAKLELVCRERDLFADAARKTEQRVKETLNEKNKELLVLLKGVSNEELEEALSIMRRKNENPTAHPFLEPTSQDLKTTTALQYRLESLQSAFLEKNNDYERSERMLQAQLKINEDLNSKIEVQVGKKESLQRDIEQARAVAKDQLQIIEDLKFKIEKEVQEKEALDRRNENRLQKIEILEAQIRQQNMVLADSSNNCDSLLKDLSNIGPNENMLEATIMNATFHAATQPTDLMTFALVDFFDFEPQTSYIRKGSNPNYDFTARYRVRTNDYFFHFLEQKCLCLEIYQTGKETSILFARAEEISLSQLLETQGPIILPRLALTSTKEQLNKATIGYITIKVEMALPLIEQYKLSGGKYSEAKFDD